MTWNWQQSEWPSFTWDAALMQPLEERFLLAAGMWIGLFDRLEQDEREELSIGLIGEESMTSARIEGELLDRDSLLVSLRRNLGLASDHRRIGPAEKGMAEMMSDLYRQSQLPLSHALLGDWQGKLMQGRRDLPEIGCYRRSPESMQVVSGPLLAPVIHFEAPPSGQVAAEMERFIDWFNATAPGGSRPLPLLTRAGLAHLWFVSIHPFEDGNGRIARALAAKAVAQGLRRPPLLALSQAIEAERRNYYQQLEGNNRELAVSAWLLWFGERALVANARSLNMLDFLRGKGRLFRRLAGKLNERQEKALERMFREGPEGFVGGMSAEKYLAITGTSRATATRDLQDLVELGALRRTGERKGTRYWLDLGL